jgi:hypothetical protein
MHSATEVLFTIGSPYWRLPTERCVGSRRPAPGSASMETAADFRAKAEQCRRLARSVSDRKDPLVARFIELATEYDARALELEIDKSRTDPN